MAGKVIQTLLLSGLYNGLDDVVMVEGTFVELDEDLLGLRQVILGLATDNLLIVENRSYKIPAPNYCRDVTADTRLNEVEFVSLLPVVGLTIEVMTTLPQTLVVRIQNRQRFFKLSTCSDNSKCTWDRWVDQIEYLQEDPYDFVKKKCDQLGLPYLGKAPRELHLEDDMSKSKQKALADIPEERELTNIPPNKKKKLTKEKKKSKLTKRQKKWQQSLEKKASLVSLKKKKEEVTKREGKKMKEETKRKHDKENGTKKNHKQNAFIRFWKSLF